MRLGRKPWVSVEPVEIDARERPFHSAHRNQNRSGFRRPSLRISENGVMLGLPALIATRFVIAHGNGSGEADRLWRLISEGQPRRDRCRLARRNPR